MISKEWKRVTDLFQAALEHPTADRERFLQEVCGSDQKLLETVQSLLAADEEAGEFMESPLIQPDPERAHSKS